MAKDTITLALSGEVSFRHFASAISHFQTLVEALSEEMGVSGDVDWIVHDLQVSSAIATIRGEADILDKVERVVSAYGNLGKDLESGRAPQFSDRVVKEAYAITSILDGGVTSIRFETPDIDATISSQPSIAISTSARMTYGAVEGRIQTVSNRKGLRFNLFDTLHDRAVSCYLAEGRENLLREVWGKRSIVEGEVSREIISGRPIAIRQITDIRVLPEVKKGSYLAARGVAPRKPGSLLPEEIIRRLRDA